MSYADGFTKLVRLLARIEGAFSSSELVCDVVCEHEGTIVRWDGFEGHFYVFDSERERWADWKDPRNPDAVVAVAHSVPELWETARERTKTNTFNVNEAQEFLKGFLLKQQNPEEPAEEAS
tara:strand:- start:1201 stop:1563 length:363 start_codon:yes stop_codon:yes gene_type:complete